MAKNKNRKKSSYKLFWIVMLILAIGGLIGWSISDGSLAKPLLSLRIQAYSIGADIASLGLLITIVGGLVMYWIKSPKLAGFGIVMVITGILIQQMMHLS